MSSTSQNGQENRRANVPEVSQTTRQKRGPYKTHSHSTKVRIIQACDRGEDWKVEAKKHKVPASTARTWISSCDVLPKERGGTTSQKLSDEHIDKLLEWLGENCQLGLQQMVDRLDSECNVHVCKTTVGNALEGRHFTVKKVYGQPHTMNSEENKLRRKAYIEQLSSYIQAGKYISFIDESNVNLYCRRQFGRSKRGLKANIAIPNSKGPNVHMVGAMSSHGLMYFERRRGSMKKTSFMEWMRRFLTHAKDVMKIDLSNLVVVLDNAPCHSQIEMIKSEEYFRHVTFLRLAPYSAPLNPIEMLWNQVKAHIKRELSGRFYEMMQHPPGITQTEHRLRLVESVIDSGMTLVQPQHCAGYYGHVMAHTSRCLNLEDLPM